MKISSIFKFSLVALPIAASAYFALKSHQYIPAIVYSSVSLLTYIAYAMDKKRAIKGSWRISEKMLHSFEILGGAMGAFIAQQILHHKNQKFSYQLIFWAINILHIAGWAIFFWLLHNHR